MHYVTTLLPSHSKTLVWSHTVWYSWIGKISQDWDVLCLLTIALEYANLWQLIENGICFILVGIDVW